MPRERHALIDYDGFQDSLGFDSFHELAVSYRGWVEQSLEKDRRIRDGKWTESVAVGSETFVTETKTKLGFRAKGRQVIGEHGSYSLRETQSPYRINFDDENAVLRPRNGYFWKDFV